MSDRRPRVLLVTRNLPPLVGGMERLNWHIADELSRYAEVRVVGPAGAASLRPEGVEISEVPLRPLWRFLASSLHRAARIARQWRPDVVLAGSGLTAPAAFIAARLVGAHAAVYLHGLDVAVRHPVYRALWHPVIRRMDTVIANSTPTAALAATIGVDRKAIRIVHPGVQMPVAPRSPVELAEFRARHGLGDGPLLLSVGRLTARKGLKEFVQHALPAIVAAQPDVTLVVIGDAPTNALHANVQTRESIQAAADAAEIGQYLRFLGLVDEDTLECALESAAVHVFPVRQLEGDPEGFGMVAIEAAAHGLPTVAFASGGIVDAVADERSGCLVAQSDYPAFAQAVLRVLADGGAAWQARATAFATGFAWPAFGRRMADASGVAPGSE